MNTLDDPLFEGRRPRKMNFIDKKNFIERGKLKTKVLFIEFHFGEGDPDPATYYTLAREDKGKYLSLYQLYKKEGDPTEARFVERYLHSWKHWELLLKCSWFKPHIEEWRKELSKSQHSELVDILINDARDEESKTKTTSAKYLLDNYYRDKQIKKQTKAPIEEETKKELSRVFFEDAERIGLRGVETKQ